uniref:PH domain-containing protein n=1 Tax=Anopheles epiroticus TaxID=199890 RepID=A0A182PQ73_9DIPT
MESKKLQQLQQANSHLAPMPQMKPPQGGGAYQHQAPPGGYDYGATGTAPGRSAMFPPGGAQYQNYGQPHPSASLRSPYSTGSPKSSLSTNSGALYGATDGGDLSSTSGGQSYHHMHPPGGMQQQQQVLLHPHQHQQYRSNTLGPGGSYGYDQQQLYRVSSPSSGSGGGASSERERLYQTAPLMRGGAGAAGPGSGVGTPHSVTSGLSSAHNAPMSKLELQFQQLQREKIQQQIKTATEAIAHQQQTEIIIQQNIPGQVVNQACQTQISSIVLAGSSNATQQQQQQQIKSSPSDTLSSPSHDSSERKRSTGGQQHTLKSPVTKRPVNAPVALSGWLYKQGSDGLKVWRRRWFVLSEYVLYYYKGQEEEKLLGTVLLPSYKVSACFPEDKIYRKFAFKCEHANMRTFVFAAENGESMSQWVRALTLATMMIQPAGTEQDESSTQQHRGGNGAELQLSSSDSSGGPQSQGSNDTMKLIQQAGGNGTSSSSGGGGGGVPALNDSMSLPQPLYANAPPKPRRVNDAGYSSPSPEHTVLPSNDRYEQMVQHQQMMASAGLFSGAPPSQTGGMVLGNSRTPAALTAHAIYGDPKRIERDLYIQKLIEQQQAQQKLNASKQQQQQQQGMQSSPMHGQTMRSTPGAGTNPFLYPSNDRRTPDTYGPPNSAIDPKHMSDYEDIYNLTMLSKSLPPNAMEAGGGGGGVGTAGGTSYKRPSSPLRYESNGAFPAYMGTGMYNAGQFEHIQMRARPIPPSIPRPHSADFLDYEARHPISEAVSGVNDEPSPVHRTPRPKSSLDINRTPDHYYYSEASYAEKMRLQSASYLQRTNNPAAAGASRKQRSDDMQDIWF